MRVVLLILLGIFVSAPAQAGVLDFLFSKSAPSTKEKVITLQEQRRQAALAEQEKRAEEAKREVARKKIQEMRKQFQRGEKPFLEIIKEPKDKPNDFKIYLDALDYARIIQELNTIDKRLLDLEDTDDNVILSRFVDIFGAVHEHSAFDRRNLFKNEQSRLQTQKAFILWNYPSTSSQYQQFVKYAVGHLRDVYHKTETGDYYDPITYQDFSTYDRRIGFIHNDLQEKQYIEQKKKQVSSKIEKDILNTWSENLDQILSDEIKRTMTDYKIDHKKVFYEAMRFQNLLNEKRNEVGWRSAGGY